MCRWNYNCCNCRRYGNVRCGNWCVTNTVNTSCGCNTGMPASNSCQCRCCHSCHGTNTNCAGAASYNQGVNGGCRMCYNNGYVTGYSAGTAQTSQAVHSAVQTATQNAAQCTASTNCCTETASQNGGCNTEKCHCTCYCQ